MEFIDKVNKKIDDCIKICNEIIQICDFSKDYGLIEKYTEIIEQLETMDLNEFDITCRKENLIDILNKNFEKYKKEKENLINRNKPKKEKREELQEKVNEAISLCEQIVTICNKLYKEKKDNKYIDLKKDYSETLEFLCSTNIDKFLGRENLLDKNIQIYKEELKSLNEKQFIDFNQITINTNDLGFGEITLNGKKLSYVTGFSVQQRINEKSIVTLEFYSDVNLKIEKNNK
jgi:hypothetical protein